MGFVLVIHVIVCILLVITILMQAGKGGGLSESFSSAESVFGTQANAMMVRISSILAAIFLTTSLILAVNGSKGDKSLMANKELLPQQTVNAEKSEPEPEMSIKIDTPKPLKELEGTMGVPVAVNVAK